MDERFFGGIQMNRNQQVLGHIMSYLARFKEYIASFPNIYLICMYSNNIRLWRAPSISYIYLCINSLLLSSPPLSSLYLPFISLFYHFWDLEALNWLILKKRRPVPQSYITYICATITAYYGSLIVFRMYFHA